MPGMEFGLLGPVVVRSGGLVVPVRRGNQRSLLAALLLEANRLVTTDALAEVLWDSAPPPSAPVTIRNYVSRLRQALGRDGRGRIRAEPRGYLIRVAADELDVPRFETLLGSARSAARHALWDKAAAQARAALALWRGQPLADVESDVLARQNVPRLAELRVQALETRLDAELRLGGHAEVVAELDQLAAAYPLREQAHALLMLALYRCGRAGDALAAYQRARTILREELGIDPSADLQRLHRQILSADPGLAAPPPGGPGLEVNPVGARTLVLAAPDATAADREPAAVPRQLPGTVPHFTGRAAELVALTRVLDQAGTHAPGTVVICAIGGTAGVGKTALAVHWAHQVASRFPGGQLYANLLGFGPSVTPVAPGDAIRGFLDALGVPANQIPRDLAAAAGLYRSLLAGRRMLILLDNARDEQQVRPLLPADPGCLVIVTSRRKLSGLAAAEGACLLSLDLLSHADAHQILTARFGSDRAAAEPDAVAEVARLCAHLPLALAVAAARVAESPGLALADLAKELRGARNRLDALDTGDPEASVQAVLSWSTGQLSPGAARMFRLLGLHPGPDISAPAAASLAGTRLSQTRQALGELARAHLITEHFPGRYGFHDLLRAHAVRQAHACEGNTARRAAIRRMLDHYLHTTHATGPLLRLLDPITLAPPAPGVAPERLDSPQQALAWFDAEYHVLLAAVALAADTGFDTYAWQLPWAMSRFLDRRCQWHQWAIVQRAAVSAALRLGDTHAQAISGRLLACVSARLGDYCAAEALLADCLRVSQQIGDLHGQCRIHQCLSWMAGTLQDRHADALAHSEQALALSRRTGNQIAEAEHLNAVGWNHALLGNYQQALAFCERALDMNRRHGNRPDEAFTWDSLGYAHHRLGHFPEAADCYSRALSMLRDIGDRFNEAEILTRLGDTHHAVGEMPQARDAWQQALDILGGLRHPHARQIRAKLSGLKDRRPVSLGPAGSAGRTA